MTTRLVQKLESRSVKKNVRSIYISKYVRRVLLIIIIRVDRCIPDSYTVIYGLLGTTCFSSERWGEVK